MRRIVHQVLSDGGPRTGAAVRFSASRHPTIRHGRKLVGLICLLALLLPAGCGWLETRTEASEDELARQGMRALERGKYRKAMEAFQKLRDWYPFSKYAKLAELKTADSYFHLGEYDEAVFVYEEFESLHPRNEAVPYVIYQIGQCHFKRMESIDRDQTATRNALETFKRLQRTFPDSSYADKAGEPIRKCYENLAGHEFYVGMFYFKSKRYAPAANRFQAVLDNYPDVEEYREKAERYLSLSRERLESETASD